MVSLRPMSANEFVGFATYFIEDYARDIAANYRLSDDEALAQAKRELESSLPAAEKTPGQTLTAIIFAENGTEQHIGYLWYKANIIDKSAYIYDFYLFSKFRKQGLGSQAMHCLEADLAASGIKQIKLRVAAENAHAKKVYEANGYQVTGFNMNKLL